MNVVWAPPVGRGLTERRVAADAACGRAGMRVVVEGATTEMVGNAYH